MNRYILMADIVGSSAKNSKQLLANFRNDVEYINALFSKRLKSKLKISLGDEFQCVTKDLATAIEIIFTLNELILKSENTYYKLRYVVNFGKIDTKISDDLPMLGSGLADARKMLMQMKGKKLAYRFVLGEKAGENELILNEMFQIYQFFFEFWKPKDYEMVAHFLDGKTYAEVAEFLKLDPSSAWRREKSLNISEYESAKKVILKISENGR